MVYGDVYECFPVVFLAGASGRTRALDISVFRLSDAVAAS